MRYRGSLVQDHSERAEERKKGEKKIYSGMKMGVIGEKEREFDEGGAENRGVRGSGGCAGG